MNQTNTPQALHTRLPWRTTPIDSIFADGPGYAVAQTQQVAGDLGGEERTANADFIVRACNSHADLLAALEECVTEDGAHCLAYGTDTPKLRARLEAVNQIARAAIAQASPTI